MHTEWCVCVTSVLSCAVMVSGLPALAYRTLPLFFLLLFFYLVCREFDQ